MSSPETEKHALQQALEDAGLNAYSYSGRSMYGRRCLAVDGTIQQIMHAICTALTEVDPDSQEEIVSAMERTWEIDSMGRDVVVYWPHIKFVEDDLDACEFDECEEPANESRGPLRLCSEHAHEHDELNEDAIAHEGGSGCPAK